MAAMPSGDIGAVRSVTLECCALGLVGGCPGIAAGYWRRGASTSLVVTIWRTQRKTPPASGVSRWD